MPRGNVKNLKTPSTEEARDRGRKGGKKSGEVRRERKLLKDELLALLDAEFENPETQKKENVREMISYKLIEQCMNGNVKAFLALRDTIGEKPVERIDASIDSENKDILKTYLEGLKRNDP